MNEKGNEGRVAFHAMMKGFSDLTSVAANLSGKLEAVCRQLGVIAEQNHELLRQNNELIQRLHESTAHSAALQQQVGVLVGVIERQSKVPTVPAFLPRPPQPLAQDPFGMLGNAVVNGVLGGRKPVPPPPPYPWAPPPG